MWNRRHRWLRRLTAGLAFAAMVVPTAAQARIAEETGVAPETKGTAYDGYGYMHGTGVPLAQQKAPESAIGFSDRGSYVSEPSVATAVVRPDDRAVRVVGQPSDATIAVRPDDRADRFSPAAGTVDAPVLVTDPSSEFNWSDAGIGAGLALGLMLLVLGAGLLTKHVGRKALAGA